jgi:hypothetical protein
MRDAYTFSFTAADDLCLGMIKQVKEVGEMREPSDEKDAFRFPAQALQMIRHGLLPEGIIR